MGDYSFWPTYIDEILTADALTETHLSMGITEGFLVSRDLAPSSSKNRYIYYSPQTSATPGPSMILSTILTYLMLPYQRPKRGVARSPSHAGMPDHLLWKAGID